jgi:5'-nucleotidase / UDP-sugar diphosphatase
MSRLGRMNLMILFVFFCVHVSALARDFHLSVLHTNDVHARLLPIDKSDQTCNDDKWGKNECFGGLARRASKIKELRDTKENVLLLDAGDQFQGTLFYNHYKGEEAAQAMNLLGYDAMAVGNHEFDDGPGNLARFIRQTRFPVLAGNIDTSLDAELDGLVKPYTVVEVGGERIGIVGYITEETAQLSSSGPTIRFLNIETSVQAVVQKLRSGGINKIIALSHAGVGRDLKVAAKVDGIDIIVAGHTHTLLSNEDPTTEGPTPIVVNSPSNTPVLIVSAYAYGKYLGYLDVDFNDQGVPIRYQSMPILLDESIPEDAKTKAWVLQMRVPLDDLRNEIVAHLVNDLDGSSAHCRHQECSLGNASADAVLAAVKPYGATAAIINSGGIRASLASGAVSRSQVVDALPFLNQVSVFDIQGKDIWSLFEHSVSRAEDHKNEGTGRFLQVSGFHVVWDPSKPAMSRIIAIDIHSESGIYAPVNFESNYRIAANRFISNGGDGYSVLSNFGKRTQFLSETTQECFINYLKHSSGQNIGRVEGRIQRDMKLTSNGMNK